MPTAEHDPLGPDFDRRLGAALDRVMPPTPNVTGARYRLTSATLPRRALRLGSALAAAGALGVVSLSAFAATGSPNPVVWTERAASTISHIPEAGPKSEATQNPPSSQNGAPSAAQGGTAHPSPAHSEKPADGQHPDPSDHPESSSHPEPSESPDHSSSHQPSDDGRHGWPSPSPGQHDH